MRGAIAKALRRQARAMTEGAPYVAYLERRKVRTKATTYVDKRGVEQQGTVRTTLTEIRLDPASTKGAYRQLKQQRKVGIYVRA